MQNGGCFGNKRLFCTAIKITEQYTQYSTMSERRPVPRRKSSNTSVSSRNSNVSFSAEVRRESTAKFDELMKECRAAYLSVLASTSESLTSMDELALALQFGGRNPSRKVLQKYWKTNTDTYSMSYNNFCDIMRKEKTTSKDTLLKAFKKIDINGDGFITYDELSKLLTMRGERMTKAEVQTILDDADYNNDGKLDYNEFCDMLTSTSEECIKRNMKKLGLSNDDKNTPSTKQKPKAEYRYNDKKSSVTSTGSAAKPTNSSKQIVTNIEEPQNLKMWTNVQSKGSFFVEEDGSIVSHHYKLVIPKETQLWLTMQPIPSRSALSDLRLMDTELFIVDDRTGEMVAFTAAKLGLKYCLQCNLQRGKYHLVTFSTGCRLSTRKYEPTKCAKLIQGTGDAIKLTQVFRTALTEIFTRSDLDSNGYLSRHEFDVFQMRTSGEHCDNDAWEVMKENFEMNETEEITLKGFLDLNLMEAQDTDGDPDDLWVTMGSMGYNKALELDQSCSFFLDIFVKNCEPKLSVLGANSCKEELESALLSSMIKTGTKKENIKGMKDLALYKYESAVRCTILIENQSHTNVTLSVNCTRSKNCISNRGDLEYSLEVLAGKREVAHHLVPEDNRKEWSVRHTVTIEK